MGKRTITELLHFVYNELLHFVYKIQSKYKTQKSGIRLRYHHIEVFIGDLLERKNCLVDERYITVYGKEQAERYGRLLESVTDETPVLITQVMDSICEGCPRERSSCHEIEQTLDELIQSSKDLDMTPEERKLELDDHWFLKFKAGRNYTIGELKSEYLEWRKKNN